MSLVRDFVKRKLNERGFHNIRGLGEIATIDEFKERASAIQRRAREQTIEDVMRLRKKYEKPIIGEVSVERLLELLAQVVDPTNVWMFCGSQLTHTFQVLESMEKAGITDKEFLATTLVHDLGKLAALMGENWENLEGAARSRSGKTCLAAASQTAPSAGTMPTSSMPGSGPIFQKICNGW